MNNNLKAKIVGTGSAFPDQILENDVVHAAVKEFHNGEVWDLNTCEKVFGVKTRHWSRDINTGKLIDSEASDIGLSTQAAKRALEMADLEGRDIDLIVHASATPDHWVDPDPAVHIHDRIGAPGHCGAFTLAITCVGITHAMAIASSFIQSGNAKNVLVTASNVYSMVDHRAWEMMFFCGDAAAAAVLTATDADDKSGLVASYMGASKGAQGVFCHYNSIMEEDKELLRCEFFPSAVAVEGAKKFRAGIHQILDNHPESELDWVITHQANFSLQRFAGKKFKMPVEKIPYNLEKRGNTLDASCGTVLDEQMRNGNFQKGDLVAAIAVGTGWHYNATLLHV
jgi:3-oxoacyl-[acyl-carrier-protein] synthase-3